MAATSNIAWSGIVGEVLTKENYRNWSALVKNYLVGHDLWDNIIVVGGSKSENAEAISKPDDAQWRSKNFKALHAIQVSCGPGALSKIKTSKTAAEAWKHLKASFSEDVKSYPDAERREDDPSEYIHYRQLYNDVKRGYWNDAKSYIYMYPQAVFVSWPSTGKTVLHVAVTFGQETIVKGLVKFANRRLLMMQDKRGYTALALAAELTDNKKMAEWMFKKGGEELLTIKTKQDNHKDDDKGGIPVLLAAAKGHEQMTRYLFSKTPWSALLENEGYCDMLLTRCISAEIFDVAAAILKHHQASGKVSLTHKIDYLRPIYALVHVPSAFPSGSQPGWFEGFIYSILRLQTCIDPKGKNITIESHEKPEPDEESDTSKICRLVSISVPVRHIGQFFRQFQQLVQASVLLKFSGIHEIYERKKNHHLVLEILKCLCKRISGFDESDLRKSSAYDAMLQAAKYGITEFIYSMSKANPELLWAMDESKTGLFSHAMLNHQEKVFNIIYGTEGQKDFFASREDVFGNNMLHLAAELGPSSDCDRISNAALRMQRDLQWFMAVETIVPRKCKEAKNADGKKPRELFKKNHEELVKAGEKWAKETAGSFTLVGTLIITIMFAAAFTVPGGNNQDGIPVFLNKDAFTVFIIADALSLITSSSSVLMFIGILTSRYAEKDFLRSLPLKLLFGLFTLILSVASMMCAFCAALAMMLKGYRQLVTGAMSLATLLMLVFVYLQLPLVLEIYNSTMRYDLRAPKEKK